MLVLLVLTAGNKNREIDVTKLEKSRKIISICIKLLSDGQVYGRNGKLRTIAKKFIKQVLSKTLAVNHVHNYYVS
jgi:hypothetical protein